MSKKLLLIVPALAAILLVVMVPWSTPTLAILAVSNVHIDPQYGYEDPQTGEWKGSQWVVLSTTSTYGDHVFYKFDEGEAERFGENFVGENKLLPRSTVEVNVYVDQPYVRRALTQTPYTVCKPAYGAVYGDAYLKEHYNYNYATGKWTKWLGHLWQQDIVVSETAGVWQIIVPLRVSATKTDADGNQVALHSGGQTEVKLEVAGPDALIPLWFENPFDASEKFKFKLEGLLGTGYTVTLPDLAIFRPDLIFEKTGDLLADIQYSTTNPTAYVQYWYGPYNVAWREHSDHTSIYTDSWPSDEPRPPGVFREVKLFTDYEYPARMFIYDDPPAIRGELYEGLVSYLEARNRKLQGWEIDPWGLGYEVSDHEIKVNMPYNSWNWMYTLEISTELADTYVWRPTYADGQITSVEWASSGTTDATISDKDQLSVTVKNVGTVDGNLRVRCTVSPNDAPLLIEGDGKFFVVGEEHTFTIQAKNLGPEVETDGEVVLELVNDAGDIRDTDVALFTLLPITGVTTLNVQVVEQGGGNTLLSGIIVTARYGTDSEYQVSSSGWVSFSLGAYQGSVTISAEDSLHYYGATKEAAVSTGSNVEVLELARKDAPLPTQADWLPWIMVGAVVVGGAVVVTRRRRKTVAPEE